MLVRDVMTTDVVTATPETRVTELARLMAEHRISSVPIVNRMGHLVGIVTEGDLLQRSEIRTQRTPSWWLRMVMGEEGLAREFVHAHGREAADVMMQWVVTVEPERPIAEVADLMRERRIRAIAVVEEGKLVGIVARADLIRALASQVTETVRLSDDGIREAIWKRLSDAGVSVPLASIVVTDGHVHLWGSVRSPAIRDALRAAAEEQPGARAVEDHLFLSEYVGWGE